MGLIFVNKLLLLSHNSVFFLFQKYIHCFSRVVFFLTLTDSGLYAVGVETTCLKINDDKTFYNCYFFLFQFVSYTATHTSPEQNQPSGLAQTYQRLNITSASSVLADLSAFFRVLLLKSLNSQGNLGHLIELKNTISNV